MASRRDELNAYTFAKRRLVAQFLQPSPSGTEEGAPRPLRAVVPGVVIGVVIMAGFGAWGMFQPAAPPEWVKPEQQVLVGSKSTTRYVVLTTDGKKQLHPVLNYASARLLLDPKSGGKVTKVDEKVLDSGKLPHGATLGIPYAPDRLPDPGEAGAQKRWAVCERPSEGGRSSQKAAFVFGERDMKRVEGKYRLKGGELTYVQGGTGNTRYIVDKTGTKYPLAEDPELARSVAGEWKKPQPVSAQWLNTLHTGKEISFPDVPGTGASSSVSASAGGESLKVGTVLSANSGSGTQQYVVTQDGVMPVTDFMAKLLLNRPEATKLGQAGKAKPVTLSAIDPAQQYFGGNSLRWPHEAPDVKNSAEPDSGRNTSCNVLRHVNGKGGTTLSTWVGESFPAPLPAGSSSAYVTPGSGQLFRQFQGTNTKSGGVYLATDNGLRYAMQSNDDSASGKQSGIGADGDKKSPQEQMQAGKEAQMRLGYEKVAPASVPYTWAQYLPTGPRLSAGDAKQPQGS